MKPYFIYSIMTVLIFLTLCSCNQNQTLLPTGHYQVLIKNGNIIDGIGSPSYAVDILIRADTIAYMGNVDEDKVRVDTLIDASGKVVTPGFIDAHAHGDPFKTPQFDNFLAMGVTTICLGQDGSSTEEPMQDYLSAMDTLPLGPNIVQFIGHGTIRKLAGIGFSENPTKDELLRQQQLLRAALKHGAFGMSTGLEYTPGTFANDDELLPLAKIVGEYDGLIMSHIRNEDDDQVEASIRELKRQGEYCNVQVSHMKSVYGKGADRGADLLKLLNAKSDSPYSVTADVYPYTASYTGIGIVFPKWAKAPNDYNEVVKNRREELLAYLRQRIIDRNGPEATLFGTAPYAGKTLAQLSEEQNLPYEKVLMGIGPNRASGAYFIMDEDLQEAIIAHPKTMICSDGSPTMRHPRGYGSFAKIIEEYVLNRGRMGLEEAVRKMTSFPAETIGIEKRGILKPGYYADILIFDPANVKANANYENPHQLAEGFETVIINGKVAWQNEKLIATVGRCLRKDH
jgi:N-acyl-D-aspartate/D-glutamate deacylase